MWHKSNGDYFYNSTIINALLLKDLKLLNGWCFFCDYLQIIEKLSVKTPAGEVKFESPKRNSQRIPGWMDTTKSETKLLKPPEKLIVRVWYSVKLLKGSFYVWILQRITSMFLVLGLELVMCHIQGHNFLRFFFSISLFSFFWYF